MRALVVALVLPALVLALAPARALEPCGVAVPIATMLASTMEAPLDALAGSGAEVLDACVGRIQPGANNLGPYWCTFSWVVRDETGALYISTAGHCVDTGVAGQRVGARGVGEFGTVAFVVNRGAGWDFALVKVDADKHDLVDPSFCRWGGPAREADYSSVGPHDYAPLPRHIGSALRVGDDPALLHYGWGVHTHANAETRARVATVASLGREAILMGGNFNPGDSGSPVMFADGAPAGVVTHSLLLPGTGVVGLPTDGLGGGIGYATRFDHGLALASAATGRSFTLVTSDEPVHVVPEVGA